MVERGRLVVFSGPSGVGKDTVLDRVRDAIDGFVVCATATTRAMRPGESDGNPYWFLTIEEFERRIAAGAFLEHARVNGGNWYGTPRDWVDARRDEGLDVILKIDVQGGAAIRERAPEAVLIFLEPPSLEELERRLRSRGTESEDQIRTRLEDARNELSYRDQYDYRVVNDHLAVAADKVRAILIAERCRNR